MDTALLLIMIVVGNLSLYWILFGKKKFDDKFKVKEDDESAREKLSN